MGFGMRAGLVGQPRAKSKLRPWVASSEPWYTALMPFLQRSAHSFPKLRGSHARVRTHYRSQKVTVAAMQMAEKKVWAHLS